MKKATVALKVNLINNPEEAHKISMKVDNFGLSGINQITPVTQIDEVGSFGSKEDGNQSNHDSSRPKDPFQSICIDIDEVPTGLKRDRSQAHLATVVRLQSKVETMAAATGPASPNLLPKARKAPQTKRTVKRDEKTQQKL